ncbi:hypothetical protein MRAB57_3556 [Mycobacterium rhizamassiliense]|uniref:Uncharacterized protein n=1 Tax=Mycobacterium rhizamassiliense TaxID=1841860 RepID=A0A2U3NW38_9MYCO|nr:hypothetical protein MRAB57_3556 [Mycobacterium rhizamassiliense]
MKTDIAGSRGNAACESQASDTTVLITEAQVAFGTAAAAGVRPKERRWLGPVGRIAGTLRGSRAARPPFQTRAAYLEPARMAREMERL